MTRMLPILAALLLAIPAQAQNVTSNRAFAVRYGWTAPALNVDDTPIVDLASFNLYVRPDTNWTAGSNIVATIPATNPAPGEADLYSEIVYLALDLQSAWAAVTAVDFAGNESPWSDGVLFTNMTPRPPPMQILSVGTDWVTTTNVVIMLPPSPGGAP